MSAMKVGVGRSTQHDRSELCKVHTMLEKLPASCVAAVVKHGMSLLGFEDREFVTLGDLDALTDADPEI